MPALLLSLALGWPAGAASQSALLSRLNLRTCADALSPVREGVMRDWFRNEAGDVYTVLHHFRDLDDAAAGARVFAVDETLEKLAEQTADEVGRRAIDVQRWQLEMGAEVGGALPPPGVVPTLLGDRLRFDVASRNLLAGEFIVGVHWEPPANQRTLRRLREAIAAIGRRRDFRNISIRTVVAEVDGPGPPSEHVDHGELYVLLDEAADARSRFLNTLAFVRRLSRELVTSANH